MSISENHVFDSPTYGSSTLGCPLTPRGSPFHTTLLPPTFDQDVLRFISQTRWKSYFILLMLGCIGQCRMQNRSDTELPEA